MTGEWRWPPIARKAHYFPEGEDVSLCGKYLYTGEPVGYQTTNADNPGPDDCTECWRRKRKQEKVTP